MLYKNVHLEGFGYDLPDEILSSREIEDRLAGHLPSLGLAQGRLEELTGIRERRIWPIGTRPSALAAVSGKKAIESAGVNKNDIDLLIHAGVCRDSLEPATANIVHHLLGLDPHCVCFDISNACVGFLNALIVAANYIELGLIKTALVVSGENAGPLYNDTIDFLKTNPSRENMRSNLASLTLGSASVAYLLRHKDLSNTTHRLLGGVTQTDSSSYHVCQGGGDIFHLTMRTDTEELLRRGLELTGITWELFKRELKWDSKTPNFVFNHQVSRSHNSKALEVMRLSQSLSFFDCETLGNTGSVAVPLGIALRVEQNLFQTGDHLALLGIGSGLSCAMLGVRW